MKAKIKTIILVALVVWVFVEGCKLKKKIALTKESTTQRQEEVLQPQAKIRTSKMAVRAIVYSKDRSFAVIDTQAGPQVVREGDVVRGIKVTRIHKEYVEFEEGDKSWIQRVQEVEG
jgi:hypothetical protein